MKTGHKYLTILLISCIFITACSGYDRVLFVTKTNVGLDIDTTPPTAEITIARREITIEPVFPDKPANDSDKSDNRQKQQATIVSQDTTLPLLAAYAYQGNFFTPTIMAHFAGGDAAIYLAKQRIDDNEQIDSSICLNGKPQDMRNPLKKIWHWIIRKNDNEAQMDAISNPRPFYFATDTTFGVKIGWNGTGGAYPDALKLGYNRKEFASPPVVIRGGCNGDEDSKHYQATIPSFLATVSNVSVFNAFSSSKVTHVQFIATGRAATEFAKRTSVRQNAIAQMAPEAAEIEARQPKQQEKP